MLPNPPRGKIEFTVEETRICVSARDEAFVAAHIHRTLRCDNGRCCAIRNLFGKPLSIARCGAWNGAPIGSTRSYVYDAGKRLYKGLEDYFHRVEKFSAPCRHNSHCGRP